MDKQNRAARKKHHVIYKTTCLVTGRYYIGMHSTDDLADGYIGSGKRLWQSIRKHGAVQHVCEVLEHLSSREALRLREEQMVDSKLLQDPLCMNLALGGEGGWEKVNATKTPEQRTKAGKAGGYANRHLWPIEKTIKHSLMSKQIMNKTRALVLAKDPDFFKKSMIKASNAALCEASRNKRKATMVRNQHSQGIKNSQYGTRWVVKEGHQAIKVRVDVLEAYISSGWKPGRKLG